MGTQFLVNEHQGFSDIGDVKYNDLQLAYHVRHGLKSVPLGETDRYHNLIGVLHHTGRSPDEVAMLVASLNALSGAVSCIDSNHHKFLLSSIIGMSFWNYGPDVMDELVELIVILAAVTGEYLYICLDMLVRNFVPPTSFLSLLKQPRGLAKKEQVLYRVHSALKKIADLMPLSLLTLFDIIKGKMPYIHSNQPWISSAIYVENMFRLESSAMRELVGSCMLVEVVNRLVELDVEIGWDELLVDDSNKGIFEMELDDEEMPADGAEIHSEELSKESSNRKILSGNEVAEHLDFLMVLTFEHLKSCYESGCLPRVFETLLKSFQDTILKAYKPKFAQFVMFYACSLDPENCGESFASRLANIFKDSSYPLERRMEAVAYLASYLSRAKFLSASYVITMLECLVKWCSTYCESQDGDINPKDHRVFYSGFQAIMYILCFHMRSMLGVPRLKLQLFLMPIEAILKNSLNPLKVCLPSIAREFMQQAIAARLLNVSESSLFCGTLESEHPRAFGGLERLEMFFPFDPYLLRDSDRYIRPNYIYWSLVRTTCGDDYEEDDDHSEVSVDEDIVEDAMSFDVLAHYELDDSLNKMSITPKNYMSGGELQGRMQMPSRIRPSTSLESL